MFKQVLQFLNQPYPDKDDLRAILVGSLATGVIVFMVLILFSPFGLEDTGPKMLLNCAVFGLISTLTSVAVEMFFKYVVGLKRDVATWTLWKWILSILFLLIMIAIANHVYASYKFGPSQNDFLRMLYSTFVVGIFPVTIFGSITIVRNLKANQKIAEEVNITHGNSERFKKNGPASSVPESDFSASANVSLPIKNSAKTFEINPQKILYLESMQNYVLIHYLDENERYQKETHRNTISAIEKILNSFGIKRTHRSYLVNPKMIEAVSGNAQGLKLKLIGHEAIVPVSRKFIQDFRK